MRRLRPIYLGDDLYACQPLCQAIQNHGGNFLLTAKPSSHKTLYEYLDGVQLNSHQRTERFPGGRHHHYHYRWLHDLPLRKGKEALRVNWFEIEIKNSKGEVTYRSSFVTDLGISEEKVVELADCTRATLEDRKRMLQQSQDEGIQSHAQFRAWQDQPFEYPGDTESFRLHPAHWLRTGGNLLAIGEKATRHAY